ncbi:MAG: phosphatidate cytidylyltransferase [Candidatus Eisenbacteria bacterium]|nr:phosphatidate cytidylyltransferase [Candidatus Eisenbacteria bacterium]
MRRDPALLGRVLSAAVFLPVLALLMWAGGPWWEGYCALLLSLALIEFYRMGPRSLPAWACAVGVAALLAPLAWARLLWPAAVSVLAPLGALAVLAGVAARARGLSFSPAGRAALGLAYVGFLGYAMPGLRLSPGHGYSGAQATAMAYVLTWSADTAAYGVGLALGRHPLAPAISPKKTWEGAAGGLCAAVLVGALSGATLWTFLGPVRGALLGALVGVVGQAGDLLESMFKRQFGAKDSASWIPGHGGVLDRYDSLLTATPVVWGFLLCAMRP